MPPAHLPWIICVDAARVVVLSAIAYLLIAVWCVARFSTRRSSTADPLPAVTVLKPLCGMEPDLEHCLRSFFAQDYPAALQIVFGVRSASDPALALARRLSAAYPNVDAEFVVDGRVHGPNLKASNLVNMARKAKHPIFVVSDSDVLVAPDCLRIVTSQLEDPRVGAVTCPFRGRPAVAAGLTGQFGALFIDAWFLPAALVDAYISGPTVCFGPVTAIRRRILERAGGFERLVHALADDTELGHMTSAQGLQVKLAPMAVDTTVGDRNLPALFRHELRWARTTRALRPAGYLASLVTHALPIAIVLFALQPTRLDGALLGILVALRMLLLAFVEMRLGRSDRSCHPTPWLLILRECAYFGVWLAAFVGKGIVWRGRSFRIIPGARIIAPGETVCDAATSFGGEPVR